jgi:hypothetical protein
LFGIFLLLVTRESGFEEVVRDVAGGLIMPAAMNAVPSKLTAEMLTAHSAAAMTIRSIVNTYS